MATKKKTSTRTAKVARPKAAGSVKRAAKKTAKKRNPQNIAIIALAAVLVFMGIGFAAYTATLTIGAASGATKDVTIKAASWDIHWAGETGETGTVTETKGQDLGSVTRQSKTSVTFDVTLEKPGDEYEFTIDAVNGGTIDAVLTDITMTDISSHSDYLTYTVTYDGTAYTQTTSDLSTALDAGDQKTVKVNVKYKNIADIPVASLPSSDVTLTLTAAFDYEDA